MILATFKGCEVDAGVNWIVDKNTITITCRPSRGPWNKKLTTHTWKNYCTECGVSGKLSGHGNCHGKWGKNGQIWCTECEADFCGVTGKELSNISRSTLKKSNKTSSTVTKQETNINDKKQALVELKKDYKEKSTPKKDFKLTIPPLKGVSEGRYIELRPPLVEKTKTFFIGAIDTGQEDMQLTLYDKIPSPGTEYSENKSNGTSSVTVSDANSQIEKTIMLKGKSLKKSNNLDTVKEIYNWLRYDEGKGNYKYKYYYNWSDNGSGDPFTLNTSYLKKNWEDHTGNCVWFAWTFYLMCKGAGVKVNIINGTGIWSNGSYGHLWNKYGGKIYDCSTSFCKKYIQQKVVK